MTFALLRTLVYNSIHYPVREVIELTGTYYVPYYSLFYYLAQEIGARKRPVFVELGVERGRGVGSFALGSADARIVGYDTKRLPEISALCARFPNIDFREESALPPKFDELPVDVLHVDTEHSEANARNEFAQWESRFSDQAIVLFDDTHAMDDGVMKAVRELPHRAIFEDHLHPVCGYAVMLYERAPLEDGG